MSDSSRTGSALIALCAVLVVAGAACDGAPLARRAPGEEASQTAACDPTPDSVCTIPDPEAAATLSPGVAPGPGMGPPAPDALPSPVTLLAGPYLGEVTQSTAAISWVTREPGAFVVRYGLSGGAQRESAATSDASPAGVWHSAVLTGLEPGTEYQYILYMAGGQATPAMTVTTAPPAGTDRFTFLVLGDSRPGDRATASPNPGARAIAGLVATERFDLALHTGDIVSQGWACSGEMSAWEQYLRAYFNLFGDTVGRAPFFLVPGNHDFAGDSCDAYRGVFALPRNAPPGDEELYYSFDWGNAHFVALGSDEDVRPGSAQYEWLERDLAATSQRWKFVFFHDPVYSSGENGPSLAQQQSWAPLFEKHGVSMTFCAHDHIYERTCPIREGKCTTVEDGGVVYFVTGGAGAVLHDTTGDWFTRQNASVHHYLLVEIRGCALFVTTTDAGGNVIDRYEQDRCE